MLCSSVLVIRFSGNTSQTQTICTFDSYVLTTCFIILLTGNGSIHYHYHYYQPKTPAPGNDYENSLKLANDWTPRQSTRQKFSKCHVSLSMIEIKKLKPEIITRLRFNSLRRRSANFTPSHISYLLDDSVSIFFRKAWNEMNLLDVSVLLRVRLTYTSCILSNGSLMMLHVCFSSVSKQLLQFGGVPSFLSLSLL